MDHQAPIIIAKTWMDSEASVIKSLLESYDIPCHYASKLLPHTYSFTGEGLGEFHIYVPASLAQEARRILQEHRRTNAHLRLVDQDESIDD